ncbi:MAG: AgmX/PglI C-terminal domain-containing protein [Myxococcales bacterium]|nr:AgmX/PglI C-terminal domain-containing protein [Myxococcales bacterium]
MAPSARPVRSGPRLVPLCLLALSCATDPTPAAPEPGGRVTEVLSLRAGAAPHLLACDADATCRDLAVGDSVRGESLVTDAGSTARLDLDASGGLVLSPSTKVSGITAGDLKLARGALVIEADPEDAPRTVAVCDHVVRVEAGRAAKVVVASDGEEATITVHRGVAVVAGPTGERRLGRGQSASVSAAEIRAAFAPAAALPDVASAASTAIAASTSSAVRGLGRMTARVPGRSEVVGGVKLARHEVRVDIREGVATTTVEEVFDNETDRVLEGRFVFAVPPAASVSRLALWVGDDLVEGEMVERKRAASIFQGIVDDTVRPRDPALLEWSQGSELSLRVFPLPARGSRRVLLSYEEPIAELAGAARYVYPLSAGEDRATSLGQLVITVHLDGDDVLDVATPSHTAAIANERGGTTVSFAGDRVTPDRDFVVTWQRPRREDAVAAVDASSGTTALRAAVALPPGTTEPPTSRGSSRVIVLDASRSQSSATLAAEVALARSTVAAMEPGERFAVLACDSACSAYPEDGLASVSPEMEEALGAWLLRLTPHGSSDLAGAIAAGASRLPPTDGAQLVVVGDGVASSGELEPSAIVERARRSVAAADVRFVGIGRNVDELVLRAVADGLSGTYERLDPGTARGRDVEQVVLALAQPVIRNVQIEAPNGFTVAAAAPRALRLGDELRLAGTGSVSTGEVLRVRGQLGSSPFETRLTVTARPATSGATARAFARARIDALTLARGDNNDEIVNLSRRHFVMSRKTSLLVLENDAMFRAFGIERTRGSEKAPVETPSASNVGAPELPRPSPPAGPSSADRAPTTPWAALDDSLKGSAKGNLWGSDDLAEAFGAGGLALSGIGEGGGGRGEGTIGLGQIGTIGRGDGTGTGVGFGSGSGHLSGSHKTSPPLVRMGGTSVSGRLPPEVIKRIVRQSFGRFRLCYEKGLRKDPALEGRVTIAFTIGSDGTVVTSADGGSTISDPEVKSCVVAGVRGLTFPAPEGGVVTVRFPINFTPGDASPAPVVMRSTSWGGPVSGITVSLPRSVSHVVADASWSTAGEPELEKLRRVLADDETRRSAHAQLIRRLLLGGRFDEAASRAARFAEVDPDSELALDLQAQALLAKGEREAALAALDGLAELAPRSTRVHRRIARGFEAAGDERRACAHWRSLNGLDPSDKEGRLEALRCRARVLGELDLVASELQSSHASDVGAKALRSAVELGSVPAYAPRVAAGGVAATVECDAGARCPDAVTIDGAGRVVSPLLPSERGDAWPSVSSGPVRTVVVGRSAASTARLTVTAAGRSRMVTLSPTDVVTSTRTSVLTLPLGD